MSKTILFGDSAFDIKTLKDRDIMITNININSHEGIIIISYEEGTVVKRYTLSIHTAQEIGFFDFAALNKVL